MADDMTKVIIVGRIGQELKHKYATTSQIRLLSNREEIQ
jgi:single-stranded DNA-binding protein